MSENKKPEPPKRPAPPPPRMINNNREVPLNEKNESTNRDKNRDNKK